MPATTLPSDHTPETAMPDARPNPWHRLMAWLIRPAFATLLAEARAAEAREAYRQQVAAARRYAALLAEENADPEAFRARILARSRLRRTARRSEEHRPTPVQ